MELKGLNPDLVYAIKTALAQGARLVCSDDPYCPEGAATVYGAPLGIHTDVLPRRGDIYPDTGYGPRPEVEAWCVDSERPITA